MVELVNEIGINPGERVGLERLFFDVLELPVVKVSAKTDKPSFDKFAMQQYDTMLEESGNPVARKILEFRGWQKTISSNYKPYLNLLSPDGRLRPNFKIHGTKTGRQSCELPNLHQIPRVSDKPWNGALKAVFIPPNNEWELWEFDFAQLEMRLAAAYADEPSLIAIFNEDKVDLFTAMSEKIGMDRFKTKTLNYTIQYGGGINRISSVFGVDSKEARYIRDTLFYGNYPRLRTISQNAGKLAKSRGYVKYWTGRRRHFAHPNDEAHKAFNAVMQGGAAEIVKDAMLRCAKICNEDCKMLLQVHDSILFELHTPVAKDYIVRLKEAMEAVKPNFGVRFKVEAKQWGH